MADFDAQIRESQAQVEEAQAKIKEVAYVIDKARTDIAAGNELSVDIENATLDEVHAHTEAMNANIAELIMGLDDVTAGFSQDFTILVHWASPDRQSPPWLLDQLPEVAQGCHEGKVFLSHVTNC